MARRMKYDVEAKEEAKEGEGGFLSRWSARKTQIAKGEDVPDEVPAPEIAEDDVVEDEEDATLTDAELLEKYDLPDPEAVTEESGLEQFLNGKGLPGRVRQMALRRLWRLNPLFGVVDDMVEYGEDYTDAATVVEGLKTAYTVGKGYKKDDVEPEEAEALEDDSEAQEGDAEAKEGDAETKEGDAEAKEGEKDSQQDENERADGSANQSDQANARETEETSDANTRLAQQNDAETALMQNELSEMLGEHQMVLDELGGNQGEFAGAAPASLEKGVADMTALQSPVGDPVQTQVAVNGEENTKLNQSPVWRPARMDFRRK
ncbi:DUF3306 domain-containing protein [Alphaproteobacteria bacterium]|nr:DUF3306 domain-containing protein [Alphaproteobacteria bacterium]MDA9012713.1 DUF3306 domain-containing protein [Alphaproteobacteria bacterium]MDA9132541.1 DUF3306 domain-containing protein [Alphaproteobacteria bacterium]